MLLTCRILRFTEFSFISTSGKKIREIKNKLLFPLKIKTKKNTEKNVYAAAAAKSLQSCPTLSDPMGYSLPGSSVLGIFQWNHPRGHVWNVLVRPASSRGATGRSGTPSRQSRGVDPPVQIRRGERAKRRGCRKTSVFLSRETGISGNFVGRIKGAKCPFDLQFLTWDFS